MALCRAMCRAICYAMMCRAVQCHVLCCAMCRAMPCHAEWEQGCQFGKHLPPHPNRLQQLRRSRTQVCLAVWGALRTVGFGLGTAMLPGLIPVHQESAQCVNSCLAVPSLGTATAPWCSSSCTGSPGCGPAPSTAGQSPSRATSADTLLFPSLLLSGSTTSFPIRAAEWQPRQHTVPELAGQPVRMRGVNTGTRRAQLLLPGTGPLPAAVLCHRQEQGYQQGSGLSSVGTRHPGHAVRGLSLLPVRWCRIYFCVSILFLT